MNKMNLPPPFGPPTTAPPMVSPNLMCCKNKSCKPFVMFLLAARGFGIFPQKLEAQPPQAGSSDEGQLWDREWWGDKKKKKIKVPVEHLILNSLVNLWAIPDVLRIRELRPATSPKRRKVSYKQVVSAVPPSKRRRMEDSITEDAKPIITVS